jgi:hypothetical protein
MWPFALRITIRKTQYGIVLRRIFYPSAKLCWSISDALLLAGQRRTIPLGTPLPRRQKFSASSFAQSPENFLGEQAL